MIRLVCILPLLLAACQFDVAGIGITDGGARAIDAPVGGPDADVSTIDANGPVTDAQDTSADACVPGCNGDVREICTPSPDTETCPLGCDPITAECRSLVPSNGATSAHLIGVTNPLLVPAGVSAAINSDDGTILVDSVVVRPSGETIKAGINYVRLIGDIGLLAVTTMTVEQGANLRIRGTSPLIILSGGDIKIEGVVDISAGCEDGQRTCGGPGGGTGSTSSSGGSTGCAPGGNGDGAGGIITPETGGGGGAFGGNGARGGDANGSNPGGGGGTLPGTCTGETLVPLMGGSAGGAGGVGGDGGDGGGGGGGLQLTSFTIIEVRGQPGMDVTGIRASGGGGRGGEASDGGGGGGSGGGILLEAPRMHIDQATFAANGGGGGGGGDEPDNRRGADGPFSDAQATGGSGGREGGNGGSVLGGPGNGVGGGDDTGGGGGGVGIIRLNVRPAYITTGTVVFSPTHTRGDPQTN